MILPASSYLGHEIRETLPSVGARIPRIRPVGDPLCSDLRLGLQYSRELLVAKGIPGEGAFPSPRSWEATSNILSLGTSPTIERELLHGTIGEGATVEFSAYLATARDLPRIESIVESQSKAPIPTSPALRYALVTSLAQYTREYGKSAMTYIKRMPKEFASLYVMDVRRGGYDIRKDKGIGEWIAENPKMFATEAVAA